MTAIRFATGLVVGKFAPLHRGHELVIERALAECSRVLVLSWSRPELPGYEPERRAAWLARRFPAVESLVLTGDSLRALDPPASLAELPANDSDVGAQRRFTAWICERAWGTRPDAVFTSEPDGADFAGELTSWFRRGDPAWAAVTAVLVDPARELAPISGTVLRADVHRHRAWLAPEVYRDFVGRVALVGGESTGKSSLARALAARLDTAHVEEYGRELWEERAGWLEFSDLVLIADEQVAREEVAAGKAREWLFCDTTPLTTLFYSHHMFGCADPALEALAGRRYGLTVLCQPDFPFVQDGTRQDAAFRQRQHNWYVAELTRRKVPFVAAAGGLEERVALVERALSAGAAIRSRDR
jgi:NadR type nicotinamide-nucleotide adenylyltransferase